MYYVVTISKKFFNSNGTPGLTLVPELKQFASGHRPCPTLPQMTKVNIFWWLHFIYPQHNDALQFCKLNTRYMEAFKDFSRFLSLCKNKSISIDHGGTKYTGLNYENFWIR